MNEQQKREIIFDYIDHEKEEIAENILRETLENIKKPGLYSHLSYIVKEIIGNANKANLKRVHFILNQLDITKSSDYEAGINTFKEYLSQHINRYIDELKKRKYYVKLKMEVDGKNFIITVENNSKLLPIEKVRISEKIKKSIQFKSIEDALTEGLDQTEGAGFGLILSLIMMRKMGVHEKFLTAIDGEKETVFKITIPLSVLDAEEEEVISDSIKNEIKNIPQFPQHIKELQARLENPNANFKDISVIINRDPLLIADLLKLANSSFYMVSHKIKTIEEAVRQIGFKGVKDLIFAYSAEKILLEKYSHDVVKDIMNHSYEVAFYAYELAKELNLKDIINETYTAAMLHDFGKIIVTSLNQEVVKKIEAICREKKININLVENLTNGYNHSAIGAKLAEKWNFPENIVTTIRYHHIPLASEEPFQKLVFIIYLSNELYYYQKGLRTFEDFNEIVLSAFNLNDQNKFKLLTGKLAKILEDRKKEKAT